MIPFLRFYSPLRRKSCIAQGCLLGALMSCLLIVACGKNNEVDDPQLKPIQEMLNTNLPVGSSEGLVTNFLATRGYHPEREHKPGTIVTVIRHIDTERLQPVTARVTFYFNAQDKLDTTEIVRTLNQPIPERQPEASAPSQAQPESTSQSQ
jgi:hypothetical protein